MKIAIISDVHDNIPNLKKVLEYCVLDKVEKIICCGDLASIETLEFLNDNFKGEIYFTFGNMDNDYFKNYFFKNNEFKKTKIFKEEGEVEINGLRVAFVHFLRIAKGLCKTGKYNFVFYGHSHKPWEESINGCMMLNPGNVAGQFYPATFAIWNTEDGKFNLIRINQLT
ncbi:MAG: metallophosphoesterase family protein [Patescibacteria group bacterium]